MGLTPDQILHCHWSGYPDGVPPTASSSRDTINRGSEITRLATAAALGLEDYSVEVRRLAQSPNRVWASVNPDTFQPNGKINVLELDDNGLFTLTIIKPGTKTVLTAQVDGLNIRLQKALFKDTWDRWNKSNSPESWDIAGGDVNGSTYSFHRSIDLGNSGGHNITLFWTGKHKNVGNIVEVNDTFTARRWSAV